MKKLIAALALILTATVLTGCDDRPCAEGHNEYILMPVLVGKTTTLIPDSVFVCDKYVEPDTKK